MLAIVLIILGVLIRLEPHLANFAPIAAIALFAGVYLKRRYALLLPLSAMFMSDIVIGFDSIQSRLTVYGSFAFVGLIGLAVKKKKNIATIAGGSIAGSLVFYLITNFAYLYPASMYPHNLSGVIASYHNALPFFRNTLAGDLFYTGLLFGSYELIRYIARQNSLSSVSKTA
ncbi:MAG TPA: DUF6580 family putative transport protein [Candidatus Saccharimonadales bacterium]|nr:DUF6580 family putative transport protein [Candidatus Saccharimonadales bacterium]